MMTKHRNALNTCEADRREINDGEIHDHEIHDHEIHDHEIHDKQTLSGEGRSYESHNRGANRRLLNMVGPLVCLVALLSTSAHAQESSSASLPFAVSNPKHLEWSTEQAGRIYLSACELVAREVRPEKPPRLTPRFLLVLGTQHDETVHNGATSEIHLQSWNPARFAEAMVLMASREILKAEDVAHLTHDTLLAAEGSVSVQELKARK